MLLKAGTATCGWEMLPGVGAGRDWKGYGQADWCGTGDPAWGGGCHWHTLLLPSACSLLHHCPHEWELLQQLWAELRPLRATCCPPAAHSRTWPELHIPATAQPQPQMVVQGGVWCPSCCPCFRLVAPPCSMLGLPCHSRQPVHGLPAPPKQCLLATHGQANWHGLGAPAWPCSQS